MFGDSDLEGVTVAGTITQKDREFVETWENIAVSRNAIIRLDVRGDEKQEIISGPRTFMVTTEERLIHQNKVRDPKNDPFLNGAFRPVIVPDSVNIESNPNALSDNEIKSILVSSDVAWGEWMAILNSPETLGRMIDMANSTDGVTLKRFHQLQERYAEVKPKTRIVQKDADQYEGIRTSGRSADYRAPAAGAAAP
jgi:hypothetical protein